jgi:Homeodomain-like domain
VPHGKATSIVLKKIERRALENLLFLLEDRLNDHTQMFGVYIVRECRISLSDDNYVLPLLKLKAILLSADGLSNKEIAKQLEVSAHPIGRWRTEFAEILSRDDLPFDRIKGYFCYNYLPVENVIAVLENNKDHSWWTSRKRALASS